MSNPADPLGAEEAGDVAVQGTARNPTQADVFPLRGTFNSAEAETGSSGLGTNGRVQPVRSFSDRLAAVNRAVPLPETLADTAVFDGDTEFDAAEGIRLGSFTLTPQLTVSSGWTDNTAGAANGTSGGFYSLSPDVALTSGWSRHQFDMSLRGTFTGYPESPDDNDTSVTAAANLRLDISEATQVNTGLAYSYAREDDSSAESTSGTDNVQTLSGTLGATRAIGLVAATASVGAERNIYTSDGGSSESGRDNTLYSTTLRLDGNTGSVLSPFVEGSLLLRRYDQTCSDSLCEKRDANGYQLRGGLTVASGPKITGELGAGWRIEDIEDSRLENLSGLVVDGSLVWSPSRLTTVTAGVGTSFDSTDIDGASGSIIYSGDIRLAHAFSDRLVAETGLGYSYRTYQGVSIEESTLTGLGGLTFALTRNVALTADYTHSRFDSSQSGSDYTENAVEAGLRFRH
ncbi:outer membrane beta-barrel protein [Labrenzia sp. 011]|uniref:outer membrane beta-barrel protein n=1 Tax=Labrenzia sp. 011 TaxID=2171494 RepID=UPI001AD90EA1|nr:outer membrane beta-barrel protein [Labrenzia sp. 011]